ncbi:MAG TPA: hypothetical protein PK771_12680 [Spirochaetota bacterium]|nr:hypothetical protein [Spirochaetota bacterium]
MGNLYVKSPLLYYVDRFLKSTSQTVKQIVFEHAVILKFENPEMGDLEAVFTAYSNFLKEVK